MSDVESHKHESFSPSLSGAQVLIVDDEPNLRRVLSAQLQRRGYEVQTAEDGVAALEHLTSHHVDLVVSDLRMPNMDGMALLREINRLYPSLPVILITAHGTVDTAVEALKIGAFDYVTKPFERSDFEAMVEKALRTRLLSASDISPVDHSLGIVGNSDEMQAVMNVVHKVAATSSTVLITGESGTGKELVARALHAQSDRSEQPFIRINCAAIPEELVESELFGYEKGAFTGALSSKPGKFELAHGGTLFLDEIGEIKPATQVKLLRAIQESEFERVGGVSTIAVDVRLVTATNRNLRDEIEAGRFREDLFYRLNVVHIDIPPLRARRSDVPLLLNYFAERFSSKMDASPREFSEEALALMMGYDWPGNIRELENMVERCLLFAEGETIIVSDLPEEMRVGTLSHDDVDLGLKDMVRHATAQLEREFIVRALRKTNGNVTRTAQLLKISRRSLQTKMKELGLRSDNKQA